MLKILLASFFSFSALANIQYEIEFDFTPVLKTMIQKKNNHYYLINGEEQIQLELMQDKT